MILIINYQNLHYLTHCAHNFQAENYERFSFVNIQVKLVNLI